MTGIVGLVGQPDAKLLLRMLERLRHRGPNVVGTYVGDHAALGVCCHGRPGPLALTSAVATGGAKRGRRKSNDSFMPQDPFEQPFSDGDHHVRVVFDGDLHNARELRADLISAGAKFESQGVAEIVLEAYRRHGEDCFAKFRGPFACAIWDRRVNTCLLARDPFGQRPLFTQLINGGLRFASEIKALTVAPDFPRELDVFAVNDFFTWLYVPAPRTIWRAVRQLPPGHFARFRQGWLSLHRYFTLAYPSVPDVRSREDWLLSFFATLERAVARHVFTESSDDFSSKPGQPAAMWVELDRMPESALLGLLTGRLTRGSPMADHVKAMAWSPVPDPLGVTDGEGMPPSYLAQVIGLPFHELPVALSGQIRTNWVSRDLVTATVEDLCTQMDQPVADPWQVVNLLGLRALRQQGVRVLLNAIGADEVFGGHRRVMALMRSERIGWAPPALRDLGAWFASRLPEFDKSRFAKWLLAGPSGIPGPKSPDLQAFERRMMFQDLGRAAFSLLREVRRFLLGFAHPTRERYLHWLRAFNTPTSSKLFTQKFSRLCATHDPLREYRVAFDRLEPQRAAELAWQVEQSGSGGGWAQFAAAGQWPSDWDAPGLLGSALSCYENGTSRHGRLSGDKAMALDLVTWLPGLVLPGLDLCSNLAGVALRLPFLDQELIEWATLLPLTVKIGPQGGKRLLHQAAHEALPSWRGVGDTDTGRRRKLAEWLLSPGNLAGVVASALGTKDLACRDIIDAKALQRMHQAQNTGNDNVALELFAVFVFELWCRSH